MDPPTINIFVGILSAVMMMAAIIYILTFILGSFSSRSGAMSLKFALFSLLYFFGSTILLLIGIQWLNDLARIPVNGGAPFYLNIGASALALNSLLHAFCGFLVTFIYVKGEISLGLTLQRVLDGIRERIRSK